jgi:hypothetical protein
MSNRQLMVTALVAMLVSVPLAHAQEICDIPVPGVRNPSEVSVFVSGSWSGAGDFRQTSVSRQNYHEMTNHSFPAVFAGFRFAEVRVARAAQAERNVRVQFVTGSYFDVLGMTAQIGRMFFADEDRPEDNLAIAVISDQLWNSMFHYDPNVVGQTVYVNGRRVTIVGVAPQGFHGVLQPSEETLWLPGAAMTGANNRAAADGYAHFVVRPGEDITSQEVRRHFGTLPEALVNAFPDVNQKFRTVSFYDLGPLSCLRQ